jgi:hypothetical protein
MAKSKPRTNVHVISATPRMFAEFNRLVNLLGCATLDRDENQGYTIHDERKWADCLACCDTREDSGT